MDNNLSCLTSYKDFPNERNDCSVRALSIALGVQYSEVHKLCEKRGRKPKQGFHTSQAFRIGRRRKVATFKGVRISYRTTGKHQSTIPTFIKKNPVGRFVCVKHRHAFAIIDGKVYGQELDNSRIKYYLKITTNDSTSGQPPMANAEAIRQEEQSIEASNQQLDNERAA